MGIVIIRKGEDVNDLQTKLAQKLLENLGEYPALSDDGLGA